MKRQLWRMPGLSVALVAAAGVLTAPIGPAAAAEAGTAATPPTLTSPWLNQGPGHGRDTPLAAAGLCRSAPFDTTTVYAPTTDVNAIVGDPVTDTGTSNLGCRSPQNETAIAVDPTDPEHLVAGANDYRVCCNGAGTNDPTGWAYVTFDAGATWTNVLVPGLTTQTGGQGVFKQFDAAGDPALAIGPDGTVYYANIVFNRQSPASGIAVSVSHDGGLSWDPPNMVAHTDTVNFFHDKELIAAGPDGRVVVTWTRFGKTDSPIVMAISRDRGHSWNRAGAPVSDPSHPFNQGSFPQFASDGTLYVAYEGASPVNGFTTDATVVARSTDDGQTFTNVEVGRVFDDLDCFPVFNGRQTLTGEHWRLNSFPSFSVDPVTGRLAVVWADNEGAGTCGNGGTTFEGTTSSQVKLVTGAWGALSAPTRVTPGTGDKIFPAVAIRAGTIAVSYYTRDYAATHDPAICNLTAGPGPGTVVVPTETSTCLDYAARVSTDGFATERRLTSEGSNPHIEFADGAFIGDYTQLVIASNGVAYACWTDFRGRPGVTPANQDAYVAAFTP
jgi:hypothetical protein